MAAQFPRCVPLLVSLMSGSELRKRVDWALGVSWVEGRKCQRQERAVACSTHLGH
jgi:hypothetical protein